MGDFWEDGLVLRVLAGSRAHGLAREGSDTDTRGVCIPPERYLIGLSAFEQHESENRDHVTYALAKFVRLALQGNPNVLETLYVDPGDVLFANEAGRELLAARDLFLSKHAGRRFMGYALDQLKRMERHHRWIVDPPERAPRPADYGATEGGGRARFPDDDARKAYDAAQKHWNHYRAWRETRNPERAALEDRHGYDTKHALHLVRLATMGAEVLERGTLVVRRPDAERLLAIRDGALTYEELLALAGELVASLDARLAASALPDEPDERAAEELVIRLHRRALGA